MRGPKVVQNKIDKLNKDAILTEYLYYMFNKLLDINSLLYYAQRSAYIHRVDDIRHKLIKEKKKAVRLKR